jgi:hypothetical protein
VPADQKKCSDQTFMDIFEAVGSKETARRLGCNIRTVERRRRHIEGKTEAVLTSPYVHVPHGHVVQEQGEPHRRPLHIKDGVVVVFADAHFWPGPPPLMHSALLLYLKKYRELGLLQAVIANGDMTDFAAISRWPLVNWEKQPSVIEELTVTRERMGEIAAAANIGDLLWTAGNHDIRFSMMLASKVPEMKGVHGTQLKDHIPDWTPCWSVMINSNTFIKHRMQGGENAARNNVKKTGIHTVTSHLHAAQIMPITTMLGTKWGVDTGCLAEVNGPQFLYLEDKVRDWREAFAVLTYSDGELMPPELVLRHEHKKDHVVYRGESIRVR